MTCSGQHSRYVDRDSYQWIMKCYSVALIMSYNLNWHAVTTTFLLKGS